MTRTNKSQPDTGGASGSKRTGSQSRSQAREVAISKALSRLLRHRAIDEGISIDSRGYVRLDQLLGWQRLRSVYPGGAVTLEEIVDVVVRNEKQRFSLKFDNGVCEESVKQEEIGEEESPKETTDATKSETETGKAIAKFESAEREPKYYFIRANQGHSISGITEEGLLVPITLSSIPSEPFSSSMPEVVVHGTFYGSWAQILKDGGLKKMCRNHVHFATGPALSEILSPSMLSSLKNTRDSISGFEDLGKDNQVKKVLNENKVISGMRADAQILIYIDIRRALCAPSPFNLPESFPTQKRLKFWKSENGVILTTGLGAEGLVSMDFWVAAVEVKEGIGVLWTHGQGLVKELPDRLKNKAIPYGKGKGAFGGGGGGDNGGGGRGRGGKGKVKGNERPKVVVDNEMDLG